MILELIGILVWLAVVIFLSIISNKIYPNEKELARKIVHIGIGPVLPFAWLLNITSSIAILIASIITLALLINYYFKLIGIFEDVERKSYGTITYGLSITLLLILFWSSSPETVCAAVLVMALGDGFAGLIGRKIQSKYWTILGQRKSIAGTSTMGLITVIVLLFINAMSGNALHPLEIFAISFIATGLEQISPLGIDNFTVPIGVAIGWQYLT